MIRINYGCKIDERSAVNIDAIISPKLYIESCLIYSFNVSYGISDGHHMVLWIQPQNYGHNILIWGFLCISQNHYDEKKQLGTDLNKIRGGGVNGGLFTSHYKSQSSFVVAMSPPLPSYIIWFDKMPNRKTPTKWALQPWLPEEDEQGQEQNPLFSEKHVDVFAFHKI